MRGLLGRRERRQEGDIKSQRTLAVLTGVAAITYTRRERDSRERNNAFLSQWSAETAETRGPGLGMDGWGSHVSRSLCCRAVGGGGGWSEEGGARPSVSLMCLEGGSRCLRQERGRLID